MRILISGRFEDACRQEGFCPMPYLSESMASKHCRDGCCPDCGKIFQDEHPKAAEAMKDLLVTWKAEVPDTVSTCADSSQVGLRSSHLGGKCCWKCASYDIHTHGCATHQITIHGDAVHVCDLFRLDRQRYATLHKQTWELRGKALQATMEDFRHHPSNALGGIQ